MRCFYEYNEDEEDYNDFNPHDYRYYVLVNDIRNDLYQELYPQIEEQILNENKLYWFCDSIYRFFNKIYNILLCNDTTDILDRMD